VNKGLAMMSMVRNCTRHISRIFAATSLALVGPSLSQAAIIIDFDLLPGGGGVADGTQITTQYSSLGVTFSLLEDGIAVNGPLATTNFAPVGQQGNRLANLFDTNLRGDILRISFAGTASNIGFDFFPQGDSGANTRVQAFDSSAATISDVTTGIGGFSLIAPFSVTGSGISRIDITQPDDAWNWGLDNLAFTLDGDDSNPVPTPATFALMVVGLAGLGWKRRKS
jgi:hypothetical protein